MTPLPAPPYAGPPGTDPRPRVGLATVANRDHMTDEAWQLFQAVESAGYKLCGHGIPHAGRVGMFYTDVLDILKDYDPGTVLVQDRREIDGITGDRAQRPVERFRNLEALKGRPDVFTLTVVKDAQHNPAYHAASAEEIGCHAWVVYYSPRRVCELAPYLRPQHIVRTYHSVDAELVPPYAPHGRKGCLLSGALGPAYPLRTRLVKERHLLPGVEYLKHPGYHRRGTETPSFLRTLSRYRVAICTASVYGYALRKIVEATAAGCVVVTDLPADEVLPEIDGNLVRIPAGIPTRALANTVQFLAANYDPERQEHYARLAKQWYDFRATGARLAADIEALRRGYNG